VNVSPAVRPEPSEARQSSAALLKNVEFFADNLDYKAAQKRLEHYRLIAHSASHETNHSQALLDIGNGGLFEYPIDHIPRVVAIDVFVEKDFAVRYPRVEWRQMSALEMEFAERFDTVIAINALHHIIGTSVKATYGNLAEFMKRAKACLDTEGKLVVIESTMPRWFVRVYSLLFPMALKLWPLSHPPTFQFYFRDIMTAAAQAGLHLREFTWIPKTSDVLFLGWQIKRWMVPTRIGKFVFAPTGRTKE
jgi:cyclopropane fatty-acyl-phospholipid synthase-like methyltransferase